MSDAFILGIFSPFTMEANYNDIAPDSEKAITALHELVHVAGFMREEEANFIAFYAGKESGNPELMYAAYVDVFSRIRLSLLCVEMFDMLPQHFQDLFRRFTKLREENHEGDAPFPILPAFKWDLIPEPVRIELEAQGEFWHNRYYTTEYVVNHNTGEVVDVVVFPNPVVRVVSEVSASVNDAYLQIQGQSEGIQSYNRMIDLVHAVYLSEMPNKS
jgi:hypothetical protein